MPAVERVIERGSRRGVRALGELGAEFRTKRVAVGLSQQQISEAARIARSTYTRIEAGRYAALSITMASRIAAVLGLDLSVRAYPGANPLRDAASQERLARVQAIVRTPLSWRTEVPLPSTTERPYEQRAWDANVTGSGKRTAMELEMRLADAQALERRIELKRRDDPPDSFVLLVADTANNRRVLRANSQLFPELLRLTFNELGRFLRAGHHPPNALVFV